MMMAALLSLSLGAPLEEEYSILADAEPTIAHDLEVLGPETPSESFERTAMDDWGSKFSHPMKQQLETCEEMPRVDEACLLAWRVREIGRAPRELARAAAAAAAAAPQKDLVFARDGVLVEGGAVAAEATKPCVQHAELKRGQPRQPPIEEGVGSQPDDPLV